MTATTCTPTSAIAVFLGPSLSRSHAGQILQARYLPPARFGDVYGLIGSRVSTIVLIDGLFHGHAPVWQRELCAAMHSGIRVYGASSMGALRAAELHTLGMIGVGRIFDAYARGDIDGDDEVALMHAGPEDAYRSLSEPLVNIRFNLLDAVARDRDIVSREQADALIAAMKAMPFWQRTVDALWQTPAFQSLDTRRQARLRRIYDEHAIDWKQRDAVSALEQAARRRDSPAPVSATNLSFEHAYHDRFRLLKREFSPENARPLYGGLPLYGDRPLYGQQVINALLSRPAWQRPIAWCCSARFFVREWARLRRIRVPDEDRADIEAALRERAGIESLTAWRYANRLTEPEYHTLWHRQVLWTWLLSRDPERFGLSSDPAQESLLPDFPDDPGILQSVFARTELAHMLPHVAAWCQMVGASVDGQENATRPDLPGDAQPHPAPWALSRGPIYFGHATWSLSTEIIGLLQITGTIARLRADRS